MGAWGTGLYANDNTCDVRDTYKKFLEEQSSDEEAYHKTLEEFQEFIGDKEGGASWLLMKKKQISKKSATRLLDICRFHW